MVFHEMRNRVFCVIALASLSLASAREAAESGSYRRRVVLVDFTDEADREDTRYLARSIPEAFSLPLTKTGNFTILNRDSVKAYCRTAGVATRDLYEDRNAVRLGKATGADVVLVGKYSPSGDKITIEVKAVDVKTELVSAADTEIVQTNSTMFGAIDRLAARMSGPMGQKLQPMTEPPPPAELTLERVMVAREKARAPQAARATEPRPARVTLSALPLFALPMGFVRRGFSSGLGGEVSLGYRGLFTDRLFLGLSADYLQFFSIDNRVVSLREADFFAFAGFDLFGIWKVRFFPMLYGGFVFGGFTGTVASTDYRMPVAALGIRALFELSRSFGVIAEARGSVEFDDIPDVFLIFGAGIQWRF